MLYYRSVTVQTSEGKRRGEVLFVLSVVIFVVVGGFNFGSIVVVCDSHGI